MGVPRGRSLHRSQVAVIALLSPSPSRSWAGFTSSKDGQATSALEAPKSTCWACANRRCALIGATTERQPTDLQRPACGQGSCIKRNASCSYCICSLQPAGRRTRCVPRENPWGYNVSLFNEMNVAKWGNTCNDRASSKGDGSERLLFQWRKNDISPKGSAVFSSAAQSRSWRHAAPFRPIAPVACRVKSKVERWQYEVCTSQTREVLTGIRTAPCLDT